MDFCKSCGKKINGSSQFCTNCGSNAGKANEGITSSPKTRFEKRKAIGLRNKRLVVGSIIGLLVIAGAANFMIKDFNKHEPIKDATAATKINASKNIAKNNGNKLTEKTTSEKASPSAAAYILPDSDKRVVSEKDIASLTKEQLRLARNEIYARHGYVFQSADLQKYFLSKSWYHPDPSYSSSLNAAEKENIKLLKENEDQ
jgi:uncharacterized membrane protein YvbJ